MGYILITGGSGFIGSKLVEYISTKSVKMDDGNYYTRFIGYLRTNKNGDLISRIDHEGILGNCDLIDEKYIYCSGFEGWGLYKINNCKVLKCRKFGVRSLKRGIRFVFIL